jgi:hypothetical protein
MKSGITLIALLFAGLLVQGYARTSSLSEGTHLGIVEAIFEESRPGVYTPRAAARARARSSSPVWAHVGFPQPLSDGRTFAVAAVPAGMELHPGDLIQMRFGEPPVAGKADRAPENAITALVASSRQSLARAH